MNAHMQTRKNGWVGAIIMLREKEKGGVKGSRLKGYS